MLSQLVDGVVTQTCMRHVDAGAQEHQLTSRIAEALERELSDITIDNVEIRVQEFQDKGRGSLEKLSGADLYISIVVHSLEEPLNKGMLVQSKWDDTHGDRRLREQVDTMLSHTKSSYVWLYRGDLALVVPASDVSKGGISRTNVQSIGKLIADGVRCTQGDPSIGRRLDLPIPLSMRLAMEQFGTRGGLSVEVASRRSFLRRDFHSWK